MRGCPEKCLRLGAVIVGAAAFAGSMLWCAQRSENDFADNVGSVRWPEGGAHAATFAHAQPAPVALWRASTNEQAGGLFTRPADSMPMSSVTAPAPSAKAQQSLAGDGLQLLEVRRKPFRAQLTGYCGSPDNYAALFVSPLTEAALLAHAGEGLPELKLKLKSIEVEKIARDDEAAGSCCGIVARAVVVDEIAGQTVMLNDQETALTDEWIAVVRAGATEPKGRLVRVGEVIVADGVTYRIDAIRGAPPGMDVTVRDPASVRSEVRRMQPTAATSDGISAAVGTTALRR